MSKRERRISFTDAKAIQKNKIFYDINWFCSKIDSKFNEIVFPGIPETFPFRKKIAVSKHTSYTGAIWDLLIVLLSLLACGNYIAEIYHSTYTAQIYYKTSELVYTAVFFANFILNWILAPTIFGYLYTRNALIDIITITPVILQRVLHSYDVSFFRLFVLIRFLRIFFIMQLNQTPFVRKLSMINRQIIQLSLTLLAMVLWFAVVIHFVENDMKQYYYFSCKYINEDTNWQPSCSYTSPFVNASTGSFIYPNCNYFHYLYY